MSLVNRLEIVGLCNQLEAVVGMQDFTYGYVGTTHNVHFGILGGKYAIAEKEFLAALRQYASSHDKEALVAAVDVYIEKASER